MKGSGPIRILELRSALGSGGGPEKTILVGAAQVDPSRFSVTVTYIRDLRDREFDLDQRARDLGVDFRPMTERSSFDPGVFNQLYRLIRELKIDIVHAHDYKTNILALPVCSFAGAIPLSTAHGWAGVSTKEQLYYRLDRWVMARYPLVVAVSAAIKSSLVESGADPARVQVLHNAVDTEVFRAEQEAGKELRRDLQIPAESVVLGAVGRLSPEKRFDLLLELTAKLGVCAVLVGDGPDRGPLEEQARELGISDRVLFLGYRSDAMECHQIFDVYVQTSDTEGVPNAVLEAMSLEVPVVATNVGGTPELIEDGAHGLLVPAGDVDQLARAVRETVDNPESAATRIKNARARVKRRFSFSRRMEQLEKIYEELVERFPKDHRRRLRWKNQWSA